MATLQLSDYGWIIVYKDKADLLLLNLNKIFIDHLSRSMNRTFGNGYDDEIKSTSVKPKGTKLQATSSSKVKNHAVKILSILPHKGTSDYRQTASVLGVSVASVSNWYRGINYPSTSISHKIIEMFDDKEKTKDEVKEG